MKKMTKVERSNLIQRLYEESDPGTLYGLDECSDADLLNLARYLDAPYDPSKIYTRADLEKDGVVTVV